MHVSLILVDLCRKVQGEVVILVKCMLSRPLQSATPTLVWGQGVQLTFVGNWYGAYAGS